MLRHEGRAKDAGCVGRTEAWGTLNHVGDEVDHPRRHECAQRLRTHAELSTNKICLVHSHRASGLHTHGECRDDEGAEHIYRWWLSVSAFDGVCPVPVLWFWISNGS